MHRRPAVSSVPPVVLLLLLVPVLCQPAVRDYAVEAAATVFEAPPRIELAWVDDPSTDIYYVYRKAPDDTAWGSPIATLSGDATSVVDTDVSVGEVYEYALRKNLGAFADTVNVDGGLAVTFTISDEWGDGMCCNHGHGSYRVECEGVVCAEGGAFGGVETTSFTAGTSGGPVDVIVSLELDVYGEETSWTLTDDATGGTLGEGGPYESPRFGHVLAGIRAPVIEQRGTCLLLVDSDAATYVAEELGRLEVDLVCDGYSVSRVDVSPGASVDYVKDLIVARCQADPGTVTLFLIGDIPVPYSGNVWSPHFDHKGAMPADVYYGELDGEWTDETVNTTSALRPRNHNVPGDGKFDQTFLPSDVELQVGRVDLHDLPTFPEDEYTLLARYLDKDHEYRRGEWLPERSGLVDDNVGDAYGTAPAALAWRYFTSSLGADAVQETDYLTTLGAQGLLWSFGVGGGSFHSCFGVATTSDFASAPVYTVFTALFGSYFGDWDSTDNLLRAALANEGWVLASFWGGRPTWHLHRMALGHTIGHCARLTQNNDRLYTVADGSRQVTPALMGDPTLKLHVVRPPGDLRVEQTGASSVGLSWAPSDDTIEGYNVYRAPRLSEPFTRLNSETVVDTAFVDSSPLAGSNVYMVRALKLEESGGGTYCNLSAGSLDSLAFSTGVCEAEPLELRFGNPLRAGASLGYSIPSAGDTGLRVYNVAGRLVSVLVDGPRDAGWHTVRWDGRDEAGASVASGVYFIRLQTPTGSASRRAILVR